MQTQTDYRFKIVYALGMIVIVGGHCYGGGGISLLYDWFPPYSYHLGLFAFCSGYFYKSKAEEDVCGYVLRKVKTLLVPLYLWNFVYGMVVYCLSFFGFTIGGEITLHKLLISPIDYGHQFGYNLGGWYVIPLFMVEVFNVIFRKIVRNVTTPHKETAIFAVYFMTGVLGICIANAGYHTGWWLVLTRMLFFVPFFGMGVFYRAELEKRDTLSNTNYFALVFAAQLVVILICGRVPTYVPSWCADFIDGPIMPYAVGYIGIAFWLRVARILEPILGRNRYINIIADNTFSIMIHHLMGFMIVKTGIALMQKWFHIFGGFDFALYKSDVLYTYVPGNISQTAVVYLLAGITFPILVQFAVNTVKERLFRHK